MKNNKAFSYLEVAIIVIIASLIMGFLGALLVYKNLGGINYSVLLKDAKLQEFISAYNDLVDKYYTDLDKSTLIEGAINGMYSKVDDPYTNYLDSSNTTYLNDTLNGKYQGIGIKIEQRESGAIRIAEVFDNSPALNAGLKVGDMIIEVDGVDISDKESSEIVSMIKDNSSGKTNLTIDRDGTRLDFDISLEDLMVPVITTKLLTKDNHRIGYIGLSVFNDTADVQFEDALTSLENSNIESLIIDLRNNTGGYLEIAKNIAESFIEKGKIIYSLRSKTSKSTYKDKTGDKRNYKIVVLVNGASASASEILAASLKYSYGATLIGNTTYGKGKVQERANISSTTTVKYTTAEWLMPNGECIDGIGIKPDYEVEFDRDSYDSKDIYTDSQVVYSLNYLTT